MTIYKSVSIPTYLDGRTRGLTHDEAFQETLQMIRKVDNTVTEAAVRQDVEHSRLALDGAEPEHVVEATPVAPVYEGFKAVALRAHARGQRVLPIEVGAKNPTIKWVTAPTPVNLDTTEQYREHSLAWIEECAAKYPDAAVCVVAKPDEFCFIDEDASEEFRRGYESFAGESFPRTFTTESRPGHRQSHWLQTDATQQLGNVPQTKVGDVEFSFRQKNEYVLSEGSPHPKGGFYRIVDDTPAVLMPDKLAKYINHLRKQAEPKKNASADAAAGVAVSTDDFSPVDTSIDGPDIPYGSHDSELTRIAGALRHKNQDEEEIFEHLMQVCESRCEGHGSDYDEMCRKIAHSIGTRPVKDERVLIGGVPAGENPHVRDLSDDPEFGDFQVEIDRLLSEGKSNEEALSESGALQAIADSIRKNLEETKQQAETDPNNPTLDWKFLLGKAELAASRKSWIDQKIPRIHELSDEPVRWLIHELLIEHGVTLLCGRHGSMKSLLALMMAKAIVTGQSFGDRANIGHPVRVVYCDRENPMAEVKRRLRAIGLIENGVCVRGFVIWGDWFDPKIDNPEPPTSMSDPRLVEDAKRNPGTFYIFDGLSSFSNGTDENSNTDMTVVMQGVKQLARMSAGALILHHTGRADKEGWRGAMAIIDQSDHAVALKKDGRGVLHLSPIRFRACANWFGELEMEFLTRWPDGRIGEFYNLKTLNSGVKDANTNKPRGLEQWEKDKLAAGTLEVESIHKARELIGAAYAQGKVLTKNQLGTMLGIGTRLKTELLTGASDRPWLCLPGPNRSVLFYPLSARQKDGSIREPVKPVKP